MTTKQSKLLKNAAILVLKSNANLSYRVSCIAIDRMLHILYDRLEAAAEQ